MLKQLDNSQKRLNVLVIVASFTLYAFMSFTRNAYGAALPGIIKDNVFTKLDAGNITSAFYITYTLSQIIGSYFTDKISPFTIISIGAIITILANFIMSVYSTFAVIFIARAITGIAQFGVWPALLKIITQYIGSNYRKKTRKIMPLGLNCGNLISYLVSWIVLDYLGTWKDMFVVSYASLTIVYLLFLAVILYTNKRAKVFEPEIIKEPKLNENPTVKEKKSKGNLKLIISSGVIILFLTAVLSNIGSGIGTWYTTMLMESYNSITPGVSNLLAIITVFANMLSIFLVIAIYPRFIKNEMLVMALAFLVSTPFKLVLLFIGNIPALIIVVSYTISGTIKYMTHQFLVVEIPAKFAKYNKAGMVAGLINAFSCLGSALTGTIYGALAQNFGWIVTIIFSAAMVTICVILSFIQMPIWKKFVNKNHVENTEF